MTILSLLLAICLSANAEIGARAAIERRYPYAGGGWGLLAVCPAGTYQIDAGGGYQHCCPNGMTTSINGLGCCIDGADCGAAIEAEPFCADSTWVLWNATGSLFCCLQSQIGTTQGCVSDTTDVVASLSAISLGQPTPTGLAAQTFSAAASSNGQTGATATAATATTTKHSGLLSSAAAIASGIVHSDALALSPLQMNFIGLGVLGSGTVVAGLLVIPFAILGL